MLLLHPYAPDAGARTAPTWAVLRHLGPSWAGSLLHVCCTGETTYDDALRRWWGYDDLLVVEHDMEPSAVVLDGLRRCPHPLCAIAYALPAPDPAWTAVWDAWQAAQRMPHPLIGATGRGLRARAALARPGRGAPPGWTWAHRVIEDPADLDGSQRWVAAGEAWADLVGLGCTRIRRGVQATLPGWPAGTWRDLDSRLSVALYQAGAGPWHIHWPAIPHHHGCTCHPEAAGA